MSKKHFIALADAIREHNRYHSEKFTEAQLSTLARFCSSQNGNFLHARWHDYIKGECGPSGGRVGPRRGVRLL